MKTLLPVLFAFLLFSCSSRQLTKPAPAKPVSSSTAIVPEHVIHATPERADTGWKPARMSPQTLYAEAFAEIKQMLDGQRPADFKRAVFLTENAYLEGDLNYAAYCNYINAYAEVCRGWMKANRLQHYDFPDSANVLANAAIFYVMTDSVSNKNGRLLTTPLGYDFESYFASQHWTNGFVFKLMATQKGNCHSLPYFYKILSQQMGSTAYLALTPGHQYLKMKSAKTGWYNTELTSTCFPNDAWIMASGYVSPDAVMNGLYMDTLSQKESLVLCLNDLVRGYLRSMPESADINFVLSCTQTGLQHFPDYAELLLLRAEVLKTHYTGYIAQHGENAVYTEPNQSYLAAVRTEMDRVYSRLAALGYRETPESMQKKWARELEKHKNPYSALTASAEAETRTSEKQNPFRVIGKPGEALTLSGNHYEEFFSNENRRPIGSVVFNTQTNRVEYFLPANNQPAFWTNETSRFLSVDPLAPEYPWYTPYQFAGNTPIQAIDLDGLEPTSAIVRANADLYEEGNTNPSTLDVAGKMVSNFFYDMFFGSLAEDAGKDIIEGTVQYQKADQGLNEYSEHVDPLTDKVLNVANKTEGTAKVAQGAIKAEAAVGLDVAAHVALPMFLSASGLLANPAKGPVLSTVAGETVSESTVTATTAAKGGANIGTKLEYVFGKATGSAHNIERSTGMLRQLESVGIFDNAAGRSLLNSHLESVYSGTKGILQSNGRYLRESLLMGPNGGLKVESIWEGNKLITVKLLGGR